MVKEMVELSVTFTCTCLSQGGGGLDDSGRPYFC